MESKNLSIVLTDLRGYSERSANSSREEIAELIRTHNDLLRPVIAFYRGSVVKTLGDSFLCVFWSATDASMCSIAIQIVIQKYNQEQRDVRKRLTIRVMIGSGDVTHDDKDVYGDAVNLVARMEGLPEFERGGIGLSESTFLLMNRNEIVAEKLGEFTFQGFPSPMTVFRIPVEKQKLSELPVKLLEQIRQVRQGRKPLPAKPTMSVNEKRFVVATVVLIFVCLFGLFAMKKPSRGNDDQTQGSARFPAKVP